MGENVYLLTRHATPKNTVNTYLEEKGLFPEIVLDINPELLPLLEEHHEEDQEHRR